MGHEGLELLGASVCFHASTEPDEILEHFADPQMIARLGIARALYRDPQVLVVDEATANLDHETEAAIVDTLARLTGEKTIIVIAHRLSVVKNCDRVYVLKQGQVQNSGSYSDLLTTDPSFRQFADSAS